MKKIRSIKEKKKSNDKRNQIIVGVLLVVLIVFSTLGYAFRNDEDESRKRVVYNNIEFTSQGDYWIANIGGKDYIFSYNPYETMRINSSLKDISNYYSQPLYVYPSETNDAILEIIRNLSPQFQRQYIVQRTQEACLTQEDCIGFDYPIKDCMNNFIIVNESNTTSISQNTNCVFIGGKSEDMVKLADEFLFKILGIRE